MDSRNWWKDGYEELNQVIATLKSVEGVYTSVCSLNQVEYDQYWTLQRFKENGLNWLLYLRNWM